MIVTICLFVRNEDDYVKDWIDWYLKIGFDNILIYDNNEDKSRLQRILKCFESEPKIQIVPWDKDQYGCYRHCWENNSFDWLACFDCDEILELNNSAKDIHELLENYSDCSQLSLKCIEYNDNEKITCSDEELKIPFYLRFPKVSPKQYEHFYKSIVNKNKVKSLKKFNGHVLNHISCDWKKVKRQGISFPRALKLQSNEPFIKHFRTKSLEEFARTKMFVESRKGCQLIALRRNLPTAYYFKCNFKTPEKLKFIDDYKKAHGIVYRLFFVTVEQFYSHPFLKDQFCYIFGHGSYSTKSIDIQKQIRGISQLKSIIENFDEFIFLNC